MTRTQRRLAFAVAVLVAIPLILLGALHLAARQLQAQVLAALGPRASVEAIDLGWTGVTVRGLRIQAAPGWPAPDELRATRLHIVPDLRSLTGGPWRIARVSVEGAYLSARRGRDGRVHLLPALLEDRREAPAGGRGSAPSSAPPPVEIGRVSLQGATLAFFDASVRQPPLPLRIERLRAEVGPLRLPALDHPIHIDLDGAFINGDGREARRDGRIAIDGQITPARHDADLTARFSGVELASLRPYLLKLSDVGIRQGLLDLDLHASLVDNRLHAPGRLTLSRLELVERGPLGVLTGAPRKAVLAAMTEQGRLDVRFTLEGRLDDPSFSLNENLASRLAAGVADSMGIGIEGMLEGMGRALRGGR